MVEGVFDRRRGRKRKLVLRDYDAAKMPKRFGQSRVQVTLTLEGKLCREIRDGLWSHGDENTGLSCSFTCQDWKK